MDLSTTYLGLNLKNPLIIGSSGLTNSVTGIQQLAENGAGAVVLKSLFEEQIMADSQKNIDENWHEHPDVYDYITNYTENYLTSEYLKLIEEAKKEADIPIIASINCVTDHNWIDFASKIEKAGADALEINVSFLPSDDAKTGEDNEKLYFNIIEKIREKIDIPIALKMTTYSSGLSNLLKRLSWTKKVNGFVLFNRYYNPDINIENMEITASNIYSKPEDITTSLRWIALLADKIDVDLVPSTGIHNAEGVIKQILAGAKATQMVSVIYQKGPEYLKTVLAELTEWMEKHHYNSLDDFRGKIQEKISLNAHEFERVQYMKYYGGIE